MRCIVISNIIYKINYHTRSEVRGIGWFHYVLCGYENERGYETLPRSSKIINTL